MKTNIGEVQVRTLDVVEGRELMIYMALLNQEKNLDLKTKSKKLNELYFERLILATGLSLDELKKLDNKGLTAVESEYQRLNDLGGEERKDF